MIKKHMNAFDKTSDFYIVYLIGEDRLFRFLNFFCLPSMGVRNEVWDWNTEKHIKNIMHWDLMS